MQNKKSGIICNNCKSTNTFTLGQLPNVSEFAGKKIQPAIIGGLLVQCSSCNIKFRHSELEQADLNDLYDGGISEWTVAENRNDWKLLLKFIQTRYSNQKKEISILDIGCNRGEVLAKIDSKHKRYGLEINSTAAAYARKKTDLTIWTDYDKIPAKLKFDLIYSTDVIEHLSSPNAFLEPLLELLNDDGVLVVSTGDADNALSKIFGAKWWYYYFPEHVAFISKRWAQLFANSNNLDIINSSTFYYHDLPVFKRFKLLVMSFIFSLIDSSLHKRILGFINKDDTSLRFQIGKGVSKDHVFIVFQKK